MTCTNIRTDSEPYFSGEDGYSDISPTVGGLHHLAAMDSLTDMFVANLVNILCLLQFLAETKTKREFTIVDRC